MSSRARALSLLALCMAAGCATARSGPARAVSSVAASSPSDSIDVLQCALRIGAGWMRPNARLWGDRTLGANDIVRQMNSQCMFRVTAD